MIAPTAERHRGSIASSPPGAAVRSSGISQNSWTPTVSTWGRFRLLTFGRRVIDAVTLPASPPCRRALSHAATERYVHAHSGP